MTPESQPNTFYKKGSLYKLKRNSGVVTLPSTILDRIYVFSQDVSGYWCVLHLAQPGDSVLFLEIADDVGGDLLWYRVLWNEKICIVHGHNLDPEPKK